MKTYLVPETPVIDPVDDEDQGEWKQVFDCLPCNVRELLLSGQKLEG